MFRERNQNPPNMIHSPRQRQADRNMPIRQNNRVQNAFPVAYNPYDPHVNHMQMVHYYNGRNGFVFNNPRGYRPQPQYNVEPARAYNFVPAPPPRINTDGPPMGVYNVINPAPCFCDAYTSPNASLDVTACNCDVCLRLCRNQPLHVCILNTPPPPDCTICGSPRNINFPHNCNVCYPVGVGEYPLSWPVCCEDACAFDEVAQHMHHGSVCNNPMCRPRRY